MNTRKLLLGLCSIAMLFGTTRTLPAADLFKIDPEHTSVIFGVGHVGLSITYGFFRKAAGVYSLDRENPNNSRFRFSIQANSLFTNNTKRDEHLMSPDFFNVNQYPDITFETTKCEFSNTPELGIVYKLTGNLTIHGQTRQVVIPLRMLGEGEGAFKDRRTGFLCQLDVKRSDFGMTKALENNVVGDLVSITVSFEGILTNPDGTTPTAPPTP